MNTSTTIHPISQFSIVLRLRKLVLYGNGAFLALMGGFFNSLLAFWNAITLLWVGQASNQALTSKLIHPLHPVDGYAADVCIRYSGKR